MPLSTMYVLNDMRLHIMYVAVNHSLYSISNKKILEWSKFKAFNPSQTTNFRLSQTERVCRQQFQI